jgi:hypothetical protein
VVGDKVKAVCQVNTAGCVKDKNWLFTCTVSNCGAHIPGTTDGEGYWSVAQCN